MRGERTCEACPCCGSWDEGLLHSELLDQLTKSFPLDWSQIQEFYSEHLSSDPPDDSMVNVHAPFIVWRKDPQVEVHVGSDGGLGLSCTASARQIEECRISLYQFSA